RSWARLRSPAITLPPPVSTIRWSAAGLASSQLLGASASVTSEAKNCARPLPRASSADRPMKRPRCCWVARWACISRRHRKLLCQAGSAKRRSFGSGRSSEVPRTTLPSSAVYPASERASSGGDSTTARTSAAAAPARSRRRSPTSGLKASVLSAASATSSVSAPAVCRALVSIVSPHQHDQGRRHQRRPLLAADLDGVLGRDQEPPAPLVLAAGDDDVVEHALAGAHRRQE